MDASPLSSSADVLLAQSASIRALARGLLRDEHAADDLVQDTWLRLLTRPPRERAALRAWVGSVARRLTIDGARESARRTSRERAAARTEALPSVVEEIERAEILRSIVDAVLELEEPYRTTVLLAYWRGWDARRIARETSAPLATVRSRLQRAHAKTRERLDRAHGRDAWALALAPLGARGLGSGAAALMLGTGAKLALGAVALAGVVLVGWRMSRTPTPVEVGPVTIAPSGEPEESTRSTATHAPTPQESQRAAVPMASASGVIRIRGMVEDLPYAPLDLAGKPAADCDLRIAIAKERYAFRSLGTAETRTDSQGGFACELEDPGVRPLFLRVVAEEDDVYRAAYFHEAMESTEQELRLERGAHGILAGIVLDDREQPLAGAEITIARTNDSDVRVQLSGDDGRFQSTGVRMFHLRSARLAGYTLIEGERPEPLPGGGWAEMRVRMGPAAALRVRVIDGEGAAIPDARIQARLAPSEVAMLELGDDAVRRATSDDHGIATLEGLWSRRKLELRVEVGSDAYECDAMHEGRLLFTRDGSRGRPIVLERGELAELVACLEVVREVAGHAMLAGGEPASGARVILNDAGRGPWWERAELLRLETDAAGRFQGRIRTARLVGPLHVVAEQDPQTDDTGEPPGLQGLGYADSEHLVSARGETSIDPSDTEALRTIELVLDPMLSISGIVLDTNGAPLAHRGFGSRIWAVPAGTPYALQSGRPHSIDEEARFTIPALRPGLYDLYVSRELEAFYTYANFLHAFPAIAAGSSGVELHIPEHDTVQLRVRLQGGAPTGGIVLHRRVFPSDPARYSAPTAEDTVRVRGTSAWPASTSFGFAGASGAIHEHGSCDDGYDGLQGAEHALQPLEPGWYVIGVHPHGPGDDDDWFPQATPILWFDAGEHVIEFEPMRAASVRGRIVGGSAEEFLAVAIADASGTPLPVAADAGFARSALLVETTASGEFVLHHAPAGTVRLRVGSRAELERGEFRRELELELTPGENAGIEVRL